MIFLQIDGTDITDYLQYQESKFNQKDIYESWTDANHIEHRDFIRTKITGKVKAGFRTAAALTTFTTLLQTIRNNNGYASVKAYVHNVGAEVTFNAYIETTGSAKWDLLNSAEWHELEITITER